MGRETYRVLTRGFGYGALGVGGTISVLHLIYNRVPSVLDSWLLWLFLSLLYGVPAAVSIAIVLVVRRTLQRQGHASKATSTVLAQGVALYQVPFFTLLALYGLTYDHYPFGELHSAGAMMVYLGGLAVLIATASFALAFPVAALVDRCSRAQRRWLWGGIALLGLFHSALPVAYALADSSSDPRSALRPLRAERADPQKVFFLGLDGADWRVIDRLIDEGRLPNFSRLLESGTRATLGTLASANSALLWASIYTGKGPKLHGCLDFYRVRLPGMRGDGFYPYHRTGFKEVVGFLRSFGLASQRVINRSCLRARPVWEIVDDLGGSVGVVDGYFYSNPAPTLSRDSSYFFSYALNSVGPRGGLSNLSSTARGLLVQPPAAARHFEPHREAPDFFWQSETLLAILKEKEQPDYLQLYTHQPDTVQHQYWKWLQPELFFGVTEDDLLNNADRIADTYDAFDRFLERVLDALDPQTTLIIASDHGHSPTLVHSMYTQHRHGPPGILLMAGPGIRRGHSLESAHIFDLTPTLLHLLGYPTARDLDGRVLHDAFTADFARAAPIRAIDSYEVFGSTTATVNLDEELNDAELEKLRALGYIP